MNHHPHHCWVPPAKPHCGRAAGKVREAQRGARPAPGTSLLPLSPVPAVTVFSQPERGQAIPCQVSCLPVRPVPGKAGGGSSSLSVSCAPWCNWSYLSPPGVLPLSDSNTRSGLVEKDLFSIVRKLMLSFSYTILCLSCQRTNKPRVCCQEFCWPWMKLQGSDCLVRL